MSDPGKDDLGLTGKVAIVNRRRCRGRRYRQRPRGGAAAGARRAKVFVVDRQGRARRAHRAMIEAEGGTAAAHAADLTTSAVPRHGPAALKKFGRLDGLDNNVGIGVAARWSTCRPRIIAGHDVNVETMF